jgi:hypothetical protein
MQPKNAPKKCICTNAELDADDAWMILVGIATTVEPEL